MRELLDGFGPHTGPAQQQNQHQLQPQQQQQQQGKHLGENHHPDDDFEYLCRFATPSSRRYKLCSCPVTKNCDCDS